MKRIILQLLALLLIILFIREISADSYGILVQNKSAFDVPCCLNGYLTSQDPIDFTTCTVTVSKNGNVVSSCTPASDGSYKCCTDITSAQHYDISVTCPHKCIGSVSNVQCIDTPTVVVTCP